MCLGIGYLVMLLPVVAIVSAFLGYKYGSRVIDAIDND